MKQKHLSYQFMSKTGKKKVERIFNKNSEHISRALKIFLFCIIHNLIKNLRRTTGPMQANFIQ